MGACEIASNTRRTIIITPHSTRRFPEEVDFVTSPGSVDGRDTREQLGLRGVPEPVIADKAVMRFDDEGEMYVESLHPGVTKEAVRDATGWELPFGLDPVETQPPTGNEITPIRVKFDPDDFYTS